MVAGHPSPPAGPLRRVLVANRGEIARRIIRTCRSLDIATVAVHSDADADAPHVREADSAVRLGPAPATDSYLDVDRVVAAALESGAGAVHPGYGFLSEHAGFARAVRDAGLVFVGPSPEVIELMGDKAAAKRHLSEAGVPVVPGADTTAEDDDGVVAAAEGVGFPLLVKAVAGGGGKGMRAVHDAADLRDAVASARREARAAFGNDRVILERLVRRPRHIEVQILGDAHGGYLHVLERECSIQRRHQKVVEEAPSPAIGASMRTRLGDAAVAAARSVAYLGAGTVEFLVDGTTLDDPEPTFYFLEMNTRLQVEHPVTELVTGLDLVALQLQVAAGEPLGIEQDEITPDGHAIEVRWYAEDPISQLPQVGRLETVALARGPGVRNDVGVESGSTVTPHYDPMLGKLIAHGPDRATAIDRLLGSVRATVGHGV
ncbi:MAG: biotin carboxylase N-terminal domain-containing protein, partial [Nitriliruptor sp.]